MCTTPPADVWGVQFHGQAVSGRPAYISRINLYSTRDPLAPSLGVQRIQISGCEQSGGAEHRAANAFDGNTSTSWATCNNAVGELVAATLYQPSHVHRVCIDQSAAGGSSAGTTISAIRLLRSYDGGSTLTPVATFNGLGEGHFYSILRSTISLLHGPSWYLGTLELPSMPMARQLSNKNLHFDNSLGSLLFTDGSGCCTHEKWREHSPSPEHYCKIIPK